LGGTIQLRDSFAVSEFERSTAHPSILASLVVCVPLLPSLVARRIPRFDALPLDHRHGRRRLGELAGQTFEGVQPVRSGLGLDLSRSRVQDPVH